MSYWHIKVIYLPLKGMAERGEGGSQIPHAGSTIEMQMCCQSMSYPTQINSLVTVSNTSGTKYLAEKYLQAQVQIPITLSSWEQCYTHYISNVTT